MTRCERTTSPQKRIRVDPAETCIAASPRRRAGRRRIASFAASSDGVVAIEVAMLGIPFFLLITGILVTGFMTWCSASLDFATQKAARQIMTGTLQNANTTATQFRSNVLCGYLPGAVFDCSKLVVNLAVVTESAEPTGWYNYVSADQSSLIKPTLDNTQTKFCLGAGNTYQILQVLYPFPIYLRALATAGSLLANQAVIMSASAFKNEPFQGGGGSC